MYFPSSYKATACTLLISLCMPSSVMNANVKIKPIEDVILIVVELRV